LVRYSLRRFEPLNATVRRCGRAQRIFQSTIAGGNRTLIYVACARLDGRNTFTNESPQVHHIRPIILIRKYLNGRSFYLQFFGSMIRSVKQT
jgi:hypothetical protein